LNNRVKARLTVAVAMMVLVAWQLGGQVNSAASRMRPPTPLPEQVREWDGAAFESCTGATLAAHTNELQHLALNSDEARDIVLTDTRAVQVVNFIGATYTERNPEAAARVSPPQLLSGEFYGEERIAWAQAWQPPDLDGSYTNDNGIVLYLDAVTTAPLALYTNVSIVPPAEDCLIPEVQTANRATLSILFLSAFFLIVGGGIWEWVAALRGRSLTPTSSTNT